MIGGRNTGQGVQGIHLDAHLLDLENVRTSSCCVFAEGENLNDGLAGMVSCSYVLFEDSGLCNSPPVDQGLSSKLPRRERLVPASLRD